MLAARSHSVSSNGVRLHLLEWGTQTQRPVLLIHGSCAHAHWWAFVAATLAERHRVIAVDLPGHGDSDWSDPPDYSIHTHARDITGLATALDLKDLRIVGHSLGGLVTIASAAALAPRLSTLAIIDSTGRINARSLRYLTSLSHWPHPVYASQREGVRRFRLLPSATSASSAVREHVATHALRPTADGAWTLKFDRRALALGQPIDLAPRLRDVHVPTLVVRGALSAHVTPGAFAQLHAVLPYGSAAEIEGAHHHVMLDAPDDLAQVLVEFFDDASAGRGADPAPRPG